MRTDGVSNSEMTESLIGLNREPPIALPCARKVDYQVTHHFWFKWLHASISPLVWESGTTTELAPDG